LYYFFSFLAPPARLTFVILVLLIDILYLYNIVYHDVRVGSRVVFREKPAKTPHAHHDKIDETQGYQGFDDAGGASCFICIFSGVYPFERIHFWNLFFGGGETKIN